MQRAGSFATTSIINPTVYTRVFESVLKSGYGILYLGSSSGMSGTLHAASLSMAALRDEYPHHLR